MAENVINHTVVLWEDTESAPSVDGGSQETTDGGACGQMGAHTCHVGGEMQCCTYCCRAVIDHYGQQEIFYSNKDSKKEHLSNTCIVGNDVVSSKESGPHFGSDSSAVTKVHQTQVSEEEEHGSMETRVRWG